MDTRDPRRTLRGHAKEARRRKSVLQIDLNDTPPAEIRAAAALVECSQQGGGGGGGGGGGRERIPLQPPPLTIDLEAIDDEVVISSPRSFAEAKRNKAFRNLEILITAERPAPPPPPRESRIDGTGSTLNSSYNMRKRPAASNAVINCDHYINLDGRSSSKKKCAVKPAVTPQAAPPKPPAKEPAFSCPVCMSSLVEATSTKCGHIFCKQCIKSALSAQNKCPTCRKKLTMKDTIRVYLPATEMS
ncbi:E3 ubiquitin-protein ligase COP1-like [Papaver somniferum]|nr:E3 ubiquitin-protein ligase COP1-like [Papaver somniferum]XP_026400850.1 E3 ubiquitin-protein ligase COP1-like [Papaver somniferum]